MFASAAVNWVGAASAYAAAGSSTAAQGLKELVWCQQVPGRQSDQHLVCHGRPELNPHCCNFTFDRCLSQVPRRQSHQHLVCHGRPECAAEGRGGQCHASRHLLFSVSQLTVVQWSCCLVGLASASWCRLLCGAWERWATPHKPATSPQRELLQQLHKLRPFPGCEVGGGGQRHTSRHLLLSVSHSGMRTFEFSAVCRVVPSVCHSTYEMSLHRPCLVSQCGG